MSRAVQVLAPVFGALSILAAWQFLLPLSGLPAYIAPTPTKIFAVFVTQTDLILTNFLPTATEALAGFLFGNLAAMMFAILFAYARFIRVAYFPVVLFFNTIPILALSPIIILIFGLGMTPKIIIAAIICFFPTLVNMIRGLASATSSEEELFRMLSATRFETFLRLHLPRALPMLFSSLRIASATAVIGAIVGEWIGADKGLGALIIQATFNYQSDRLYAAIVASSSLSIALFALVALIEARVMRGWAR
ncbi:MAG: ABC transporter permease [Boseongicola sp.]|nr:ABC transporter permease [Boseongicola sp.]MYH56782.1 ABC transporter permease [Boseongicola sp. SB0675_bin_26]